MKRALIIFTRVPIAGKTKTRMMPDLSPDKAAEFHSCVLKDMEEEFSNLNADIFIYFKKDVKDVTTALEDIFPGKKLCEQNGTDLFDSMNNAFEDLINRGYEKIVLIGSDVPEILKSDVEEAFRLLEEKDVVFGPSKDGGYYLVAMKKANREVFNIKTKDGSDVLKVSIHNVKKESLRFSLIREIKDMDTYNDLKTLFSGRLNLKAEHCKNFLAENIKISIVIPIYKEGENLKRLISDIKKYAPEAEIIVAYTDEDKDIAESLKIGGVKKVKAPKGRGIQQNEGAMAAEGEIILFLHSDTVLYRNFMSDIRNAVKNYRTGCFKIAFDDKSLIMKICAFMSNIRAKKGIMFGDQAIFIDRELFNGIGGFKERYLMEDLRLSLDLKEREIENCVIDNTVISSARRFRGSILHKIKTFILMRRLRRLYLDGVSSEKLCEMYRDER